MDDKIFDKIHEVDLKETMETSYIDYAMSVIASRALPDVNVPVSLVIQWVNSIHMVIALFTEHWLTWLRNGIQDIL